MLVSGRTLLKCVLHLHDGSAAVSDMYVDDTEWRVLHVVAEAGSLFASRQVLVPTGALGQPDTAQRVIPAALSKSELNALPDTSDDDPVSRQNAKRQSEYLGGNPDRQRTDSNQHLRSLRELAGYAVQTHGGQTGPVSDVLCFCGVEWTVRYIIVDLGSVLSSRRFLIPTPIVRKVRWEDRTIDTYVSEQAIAVCPEYGGLDQVSSEYERALHRAYRGREGLWWPEERRDG
ncbi:MAG: hypothetical protein JXB46_11150 [Candidatus Eisenbacteria bacterium]|nr:hypothetical protein [Candidatus Eisenbacteria bacterium]